MIPDPLEHLLELPAYLALGHLGIQLHLHDVADLLDRERLARLMESLPLLAQEQEAQRGEHRVALLITDRFSVYRVHDTKKRQLCWAHLIRNFRGLEERGGKARSLGIAGQQVVKDVFREWYRFRDGEITRRGLQRKLKPIRKRLERLLRRHVSNPVPAARKIAKDLREYGAALWTFAKIEGVEPTNNAAERAVRKGVLWRKGSFGSHSADGSRFAERMLTVSESLRAQGRSILEFLETSIGTALAGTPHPSLLPAT